MFNEDARVASKRWITLTSRDRGKPAEERAPCAACPTNADAYIARLIAKGTKVAICEQMEDPALAKGHRGAGHHPGHHPGHSHRLLHAGRRAATTTICAIYEGLRLGLGPASRHLHR